MFENRMIYFIGLIVICNVLLLYLLLKPSIDQLRLQIEPQDSVEAVFFPQIDYDYYYDFVLDGTEIDGNWKIETYREVKVLVDVDGKKVSQTKTGNIEYMRYWIGN